MQMKKKGLLLCCIVSLGALLFIMCVSVRTENSTDEILVHYSQFPKEIQLTGEEFMIKGEYVRFPFRIRQKGEYVYILDMHGEKNFCHILKKENMAIIASFAQRGNGPEEVLQAMNLHVVSEDSIWLYDTNKREVTLWEYSPQKQTVSYKDCIKFEDKIQSSSNCAWESDSVFFFTDKSGYNRILMCNKGGDIKEYIGEIPSENNKEASNLGIMAQAWNSYIHYNPRNQLLATATQLGEVIEVYDLKTNSRQIIVGPHGEPQYAIAKDGWAVPKGIMGFSDIQITDNYIYTVFHGRTFKEIIKDPNNTLDGGEYIHIYNLNGEPICRLVLDHAIYGIDVDEENKIIWATDVNSEEQILKFQLPEIKNIN